MMEMHYPLKILFSTSKHIKIQHVEVAAKETSYRIVFHTSWLQDEGGKMLAYKYVKNTLQTI
jgi:hypothetical protein